MGTSPAGERHRILEGLEVRELIRGGFMEEARSIRAWGHEFSVADWTWERGCSRRAEEA